MTWTRPLRNQVIYSLIIKLCESINFKSIFMSSSRRDYKIYIIYIWWHEIPQLSVTRRDMAYFLCKYCSWPVNGSVFFYVTSVYSRRKLVEVGVTDSFIRLFRIYTNVPLVFNASSPYWLNKVCWRSRKKTVSISNIF